MRYFHRKKFAPIHGGGGGRPAEPFKLFRSKKVEQIFFHEFFAWTRLNKPLASQKTIYEHKDLAIWFSTNWTFDPSWRFFTFGRLRGLRRPLNCPQILFISFEHLTKILYPFQNWPWNRNWWILHRDIPNFPIKNQQNHGFSENLKILYFHFFWLKSSNQNIFSQN